MRNLRKMSFAVAIIVLTSCSGQEQRVLSNFFQAVQGGDETAVSRLSLTAFDGGVESWELIEIGTESVEPFELPAIHEQLMKKRSEVRVANEINANYAGDHRALFAAYQKKKAEGRAHTDMVGMSARKLLDRILAVLRDQREYEKRNVKET